MLEKGATVSLADEERRLWSLVLSGSLVTVGQVGLVDTSRLIGGEYGDIVDINERRYTIVRPTLEDLLSGARRKAQIITLKDAAVIVARTGVKAGDVVVEAGAGSGAMTICLCHAVSPSGSVITYEERKDFADIARQNVEKAGFGHISTIKVGDAADMDDVCVSAVIMDVPEPWRIMGAAWEALLPGGSLAVYVPTVNQAEKSVRDMRGMGFQNVLCTETIERELDVGSGGSRPSFTSPGHTGYIITARRLGT